MTHTLLLDASLLDFYWHNVVQTVTYLINRLPTPLLNGFSPYYKLFSKPPDYNFLRVFGCQRFPNITRYTKHKLQPHFAWCVFLGNAPHYKAYKYLGSHSGRIYVSRHVVFHESVFPYSQIVDVRPSPSRDSGQLLPVWATTLACL